MSEHDQPDQPDQESKRNEQARERVEDARSEAAAYVIQRQPLEPGTDTGAVEERVADASHESQQADDPEQLEDLAEEAETGRDELRRELYGPGSEKPPK